MTPCFVGSTSLFLHFFEKYSFHINEFFTFNFPYTTFLNLKKWCDNYVFYKSFHNRLSTILDKNYWQKRKNSKTQLNSPPSPPPIINVGISISSSIAKNNIDTGGRAKNYEENIQVCCCVLQLNLFLPLFLSRIVDILGRYYKNIRYAYELIFQLQRLVLNS